MNSEKSAYLLTILITIYKNMFWVRKRNYKKRLRKGFFGLLLYVPSQQLWSWRNGQFTQPHFFLDKLEQAVNQYLLHILSLVTDNNPSRMIQQKGGEWP